MSGGRQADPILEVLGRRPGRPLTLEELAGRLPNVKDLAGRLGELEARGSLVRTRTGRYGLPGNMNLAAGRLEITRGGHGFVVGEGPDVHVAPGDLGGARQGDRVIVRLLPPARHRRRSAPGPSGEVIRVLERAGQPVVGTLELRAGVGLVIPDDPRHGPPLLIPAAKVAGALAGHTVVAAGEDWGDGRRPSAGRVVADLGPAGDPGTDIPAVLHRHGLPPGFPPEVLAAAAGLPREVRPEDRAGREDLRDLGTVTIDGEDARDHDDAVSIRRLPGGGYRLWVHVADVAHYVPEGGVLDREAGDRGTSVYLVDRVLPMFPPALSEGIASLNPGVERLAVTVTLDFGPGGALRRKEFCRSLIRVDERMTYPRVKAILDGDPVLCRHHAPLVEPLGTMRELALQLREGRRRRGSLDFELPEAEVELDAGGNPVSIKRAERSVADQIIEEFMLQANQAVAAHLEERGFPLLYRVHEPPDPSRLEDLAEFLGALGFVLGTRGALHRRLQAVVERARGGPLADVAGVAVLRSLKLARYSPEDAGHFGLATRCYTHFTSPIRRYPDLVVHRQLVEAMAGKQPGSPASLGEVADVASARERRAAEAEMEGILVKKVRYLAARLGEVYPGKITGVTSFGFFVGLENTVEGLVHVSTLGDDYYRFDPARQALVGRRSARLYRPGQAVQVQVARASIATRQVEFMLVGGPPDRPPPKARRRGGARSRSGR
ncbi:MAG: ribonuclease R [bacterium]|nr:ribonuclease R [bacterium]